MNYSPFVKGLNSAIMTLCTLIMIALSAQSFFQDSLFRLLSINITILLAGANLTCIIITFALSRYEKKLNEDEDPCEGIEKCKKLLMLNGTSKEAIETYEKVQSCVDNLPMKYIHKGPKRQKKFLLYNKIVTRPEMKTYEEIQEALNALL